MNIKSAQMAREVADKKTQETGRWVMVAGAVGPMNRTASLSPKLEDPSFRNVSKLIFFLFILIAFEEIADSYEEQI